jgi:hypothetical protein
MIRIELEVSYDVLETQAVDNLDLKPLKARCFADWAELRRARSGRRGE